MRKKLMSILMISMLTLTSIVGCQKANVEGNESEKSKKEVTITDFRGKEITLNVPVDKVVCLLNSGLNDMYMLGCKDKVVGIDKWTYDTKDIYETTSKIDERVKDKSLPAVDGNIEKIVALEPDAVIVWSESEDIKALEEKGIKVIGVQVNNFEDVQKKLELIAQICGKEERAQEILKYTNGKLDEINKSLSKVSDKDKLNGVFTWGPSDLDFAGNNSTGNTILEYSGLKNSASKVNEEHFVASMEDTVAWNPQSIVIWNNQDVTPDTYYNDSKWKSVDAVKNKKVMQIPTAFHNDLWTVKYINAINMIANTFYPDAMGNKDIDQDQKDMMKFLYGIEL